MANTDYTYVTNGTAAVGRNDQENYCFWSWAYETYTHLITLGWDVVGSSRYNKGTASWEYSVVPDGMSHWLSNDAEEHMDNLLGESPWMVLEHSVSGYQICLHVRSSITGKLTIAFAKNKFETGGAWRNGGSEGTRPFDTSSSPTINQEIVSEDVNQVFSLATTQSMTWHTASRNDGSGFYSWGWEIGGTANKRFFMGVFPQSVPHTGDQNGHIVFQMNSNTINEIEGVDDPFGAPDNNQKFFDRDETGALRYIAPIKFEASPYGVGDPVASVVDLYRNKHPLFPFAFWTNAGVVNRFRFSLPDVLVGGISYPGTTQPYGNTFNSKTYVRLGVLALPWDSVTVPSADDGLIDVDAFQVMEPTSNLIEGPNVLDPKSFWRGIEKI